MASEVNRSIQALISMLTRSQIKNRFRDSAVGGGYRDLNINIEFEGLVYEVKIRIREFFELKAGAHPCI